jgi:hypothetical protein
MERAQMQLPEEEISKAYEIKHVTKIDFNQLNWIRTQNRTKQFDDSRFPACISFK